MKKFKVHALYVTISILCCFIFLLHYICWTTLVTICISDLDYHTKSTQTINYETLVQVIIPSSRYKVILSIQNITAMYTLINNYNSVIFRILKSAILCSFTFDALSKFFLYTIKKKEKRKKKIIISILHFISSFTPEVTSVTLLCATVSPLSKAFFFRDPLHYLDLYEAKCYLNEPRSNSIKKKRKMVKYIIDLQGKKSI